MVSIDKYTYYCIRYLAKRESDLFEVSKDFVQKEQANFNLKVIYFYIDSSRKYLSNPIKEFCANNGIAYYSSVP